MNKFLAIPLLAIIAGCATSSTNLPTQSGVDLNKYMGTWYEQARLPNRFQKDCTGDIQADYALNPDETVSVTNQCRTSDGSTNVAKGEGRLSKSVDVIDPAILQVRFAPKWTSWLPMVWGDYWIMKIQGDYQHSLVGTPDRKYLWVLSREKQADTSIVTSLLEYAQSEGFDTASVIMASD